MYSVSFGHRLHYYHWSSPHFPLLSQWSCRLVLIWQDCFRIAVPCEKPAFLWPRREPFPHRCCVLSERLPSAASWAIPTAQLTGVQEKVLCLGPACVALPMLAGSHCCGSESELYERIARVPASCVPSCLHSPGVIFPSLMEGDHGIGTLAPWQHVLVFQCAV